MLRSKQQQAFRSKLTHAGSVFKPFFTHVLPNDRLIKIYPLDRHKANQKSEGKKHEPNRNLIFHFYAEHIKQTNEKKIIRYIIE